MKGHLVITEIFGHGCLQNWNDPRNLDIDLWRNGAIAALASQENSECGVHVRGKYENVYEGEEDAQKFFELTSFCNSQWTAVTDQTSKYVDQSGEVGRNATAADARKKWTQFDLTFSGCLPPRADAPSAANGAEGDGPQRGSAPLWAERSPAWIYFSAPRNENFMDGCDGWTDYPLRTVERYLEATAELATACNVSAPIEQRFQVPWKNMVGRAMAVPFDLGVFRLGHTGPYLASSPHNSVWFREFPLECTGPRSDWQVLYSFQDELDLNDPRGSGAVSSPTIHDDPSTFDFEPQMTFSERFADVKWLHLIRGYARCRPGEPWPFSRDKPFYLIYRGTASRMGGSAPVLAAETPFVDANKRDGTHKIQPVLTFKHVEANIIGGIIGSANDAGSASDSVYDPDCELFPRHYEPISISDFHDYLSLYPEHCYFHYIAAFATESTNLMPSRRAVVFRRYQPPGLSALPALVGSKWVGVSVGKVVPPSADDSCLLLSQFACAMPSRPWPLDLAQPSWYYMAIENTHPDSLSPNYSFQPPDPADPLNGGTWSYDESLPDPYTQPVLPRTLMEMALEDKAVTVTFWGNNCTFLPGPVPVEMRFLTIGHGHLTPFTLQPLSLHAPRPLALLEARALSPSPSSPPCPEPPLEVVQLIETKGLKWFLEGRSADCVFVFEQRRAAVALPPDNLRFNLLFLPTFADQPATAAAEDGILRHRQFALRTLAGKNCSNVDDFAVRFSWQDAPETLADFDYENRLTDLSLTYKPEPASPDTGSLTVRFKGANEELSLPKWLVIDFPEDCFLETPSPSADTAIDIVYELEVAGLSGERRMELDDRTPFWDSNDWALTHASGFEWQSTFPAHVCSLAHPFTAAPPTLAEFETWLAQRPTFCAFELRRRHLQRRAANDATAPNLFDNFLFRHALTGADFARDGIEGPKLYGLTTDNVLHRPSPARGAGRREHSEAKRGKSMVKIEENAASVADCYPFEVFFSDAFSERDLPNMAAASREVANSAGKWTDSTGLFEDTPVNDPSKPDHFHLKIAKTSDSDAVESDFDAAPSVPFVTLLSLPEHCFLRPDFAYNYGADYVWRGRGSQTLATGVPATPTPAAQGVTVTVTLDPRAPPGLQPLCQPPTFVVRSLDELRDIAAKRSNVCVFEAEFELSGTYPSLPPENENSAQNLVLLSLPFPAPTDSLSERVNLSERGETYNVSAIELSVKASANCADAPIVYFTSAPEIAASLGPSGTLVSPIAYDAISDPHTVSLSLPSTGETTIANPRWLELQLDPASNCELSGKGGVDQKVEYSARVKFEAAGGVTKRPLKNLIEIPRVADFFPEIPPILPEAIFSNGPLTPRIVQEQNSENSASPAACGGEDGETRLPVWLYSWKDVLDFLGLKSSACRFAFGSRSDEENGGETELASRTVNFTMDTHGFQGFRAADGNLIDETETETGRALYKNLFLEIPLAYDLSRLASTPLADPNVSLAIEIQAADLVVPSNSLSLSSSFSVPALACTATAMLFATKEIEDRSTATDGVLSDVSLSLLPAENPELDMRMMFEFTSTWNDHFVRLSFAEASDCWFADPLPLPPPLPLPRPYKTAMDKSVVSSALVTWILEAGGLMEHPPSAAKREPIVEISPLKMKPLIPSLIVNDCGLENKFLELSTLRDWLTQESANPISCRSLLLKHGIDKRHVPQAAATSGLAVAIPLVSASDIWNTESVSEFVQRKVISPFLRVRSVELSTSQADVANCGIANVWLSPASDDWSSLPQGRSILPDISIERCDQGFRLFDKNVGPHISSTYAVRPPRTRPLPSVLDAQSPQFLIVQFAPSPTPPGAPACPAIERDDWHSEISFDIFNQGRHFNDVIRPIDFALKAPAPATSLAASPDCENSAPLSSLDDFVAYLRSAPTHCQFELTLTSTGEVRNVEELWNDSRTLVAFDVSKTPAAAHTSDRLSPETEYTLDDIAFHHPPLPAPFQPTSAISPAPENGLSDDGPSDDDFELFGFVGHPTFADHENGFPLRDHFVFEWEVKEDGQIWLKKLTPRPSFHELGQKIKYFIFKSHGLLGRGATVEARMTSKGTGQQASGDAANSEL